MNPFLRVIEALNKHDVRYVVVGGFAAYLHGSPRITVDLDLVVDLNPPQTRKAIGALLSIGMQARLPVDPYQFADQAIREAWIREKNMVVFSLFNAQTPGFILALFVREPKSFDLLYANRKVVEADGLVIPLCGIQDLIEMKIEAGRPKDLLDVETLKLIKSAGNESR
jgi:hypothetical protein